ncbi:hypothetical protein Cantr_10638 [Candida viswanathii]|uniref:Proteasome chaperone 3 n=1 Tax=Candida viswanathii TaxID=5486 RepID=A0A367YE68_9ASCO|nr:hypothetical protein Cantr_10638 [Candida viswanathii]
MSTEISQDPTGFSKSFRSTYQNDTEDEFFFHIINYANQQIINIAINGLLDTTFELPVSTKSTINYASSMEIQTDGYDEEEEDREREVIPEPVLLIGDHANMKLLIVASQVSKIVSVTSPKPTILSIGSKWFGKGDEVHEDDFERLMFILENVKKLL